MNKMRLEDLKSGHLFKIEFANSINWAKVKYNNPKDRKICVSVGYKLLGLFYVGLHGTIVRDYSSYNFTNVEYLNT